MVKVVLAVILGFLWSAQGYDDCLIVPSTPTDEEFVRIFTLYYDLALIYLNSWITNHNHRT